MKTKPPKEVSDCCGATFTESNKYPGVLVCDECHNPCYSNPSETNKPTHLVTIDKGDVSKPSETNEVKVGDYVIIDRGSLGSWTGTMKSIVKNGWVVYGTIETADGTIHAWDKDVHTIIKIDNPSPKLSVKEVEGWAIKFDERWKPCYIGQVGEGGAEVSGYIKDFIRSSIERARRAERQRVVKMIENEIEPEIDSERELGNYEIATALEKVLFRITHKISDLQSKLHN